MKKEMTIDLQRFQEAQNLISNMQKQFCELVKQTLEDNPFFKCDYCNDLFYSKIYVSGFLTTLKFDVHPTYSIVFNQPLNQNHTFLANLRFSCPDLSLYNIAIKLNTKMLKLYCNSDIPSCYLFNGRILTVINGTMN